MRCTSNCTKCRIAAMALAVTAVVMTGCGRTEYDMAYELNSDVSGFQLLNVESGETLEPFAADLCVAGGDVKKIGTDFPEVGAAALFDLKNLDTLYAKNVNVQMNPASLTKIMTALVAIKYGSPDQMLTASENVRITEPGAQLCGLKAGDQMTLDQALHILLIYSANDVAVMIAEGISGSVEEFTALMNEEAEELGATNCNFVNPNGLTEEEHYVTAYDLYLIFQEALKYELFQQIIQMTSYNTVYTDRNGEDVTFETNTTNLFLNGTHEAPSGVTVIGGKTGTTSAAGHCLILYVKGSDGTPYISVIMKDVSKDDLYADMSRMLESVK